ncbi:MAG TPA: nicotinamide-nucleotide amidohydrolase family protein, partial [Mizugakiibacter sp.]|nr:nicotinamide-nucleotide amidohydrolase family protein [Mizugakiibacter sp.]
MDAPWIPTDTELGLLVREVGAELQHQEQMLVTAESCTGGWLAKALTDRAGSSAWFAGGVVAYRCQVKQALLGVNPHTLEQSGAVSRETVLEMVSGALVHM